jgi:hypothetical protein
MKIFKKDNRKEALRKELKLIGNERSGLTARRI